MKTKINATASFASLNATFAALKKEATGLLDAKLKPAIIATVRAWLSEGYSIPECRAAIRALNREHELCSPQYVNRLMTDSPKKGGLGFPKERIKEGKAKNEGEGEGEGETAVRGPNPAFVNPEALVACLVKHKGSLAEATAFIEAAYSVAHSLALKGKAKGKVAK